MNRPEMKSTQFALLVVESATGIVLNTEFQWFLSDGKDVYFVFDDLQLLKDFISQTNQKHKGYDYNIYDSDYTLIEFI